VQKTLLDLNEIILSNNLWSSVVDLMKMWALKLFLHDKGYQQGMLDPDFSGGLITFAPPW
jgi:hypothetical protein